MCAGARGEQRALVPGVETEEQQEGSGAPQRGNQGTGGPPLPPEDGVGRGGGLLETTWRGQRGDRIRGISKLHLDEREHKEKK